MLFRLIMEASMRSDWQEEGVNSSEIGFRLIQASSNILQSRAALAERIASCEIDIGNLLYP